MYIHLFIRFKELLKFIFTCHFTLLYSKTVTIHTVDYAYHLVQMFRILKASTYESSMDLRATLSEEKAYEK